MTVNQRNYNIVRLLKSGKTLREIGAKYNLDHKAVYRIGAKVGVYSVRSKRTA